jgi:hypothetical protein
MLGDSEEVLVDLHPHWVFLAAPAAVTAVAIAVAATITTEFPKAPVGVGAVLAAMVAVPLIWFVVRLIRWLSISVVVTNYRVLLRRGVFRRDVAQLRLQRVVEVHSSQSLFERMIGSGRLIFDVEGDDGPISVDDVRRPKSLQRVISARLSSLDAYRGGGPQQPWADPTSPGVGRLPDETPPHGVPASSAAPALEPVGTPPPAPSTPPAPSSASVHQQLIELDDLRQRGIVTQDEFDRKKADLLSRL